jgi:hypothetical protein
MYQRSERSTPVWVTVLGGLLFVFGGFALYSGVLSFLNGGGDITAPITRTAAYVEQATREQAEARLQQYGRATFTPIPSRTAVPPCQDFRVNVIKAKVRECPSETCPTLEAMVSQGNLVCVVGAVPNANQWYQINLRPNSTYPDFGYMHNSVIDAVRPTPRPTRTPTGLPTVTAVPTLRPTRTPTPLPITN